MAWADLEDVITITGQETSETSLALAQTLIEIKVGTDTDASDQGLISSKNLKRLQRAVAFQAVWLDAHPDVLQVMDVQGVSQDGLSAQYRSPDSALYSPIALMDIRRLSWMTAPLRTRRGRGAYTDRGNRDSAVADDRYEWTPL